MESSRRIFAQSALPPRVLIVEDEAIVAEDLSHKLTALGYQVVGIVPTGEGAIQAVQQSSVDAVLLDLQLAGTLDGIQTAQRLHDVCDAAIVFSTAHSDSETVKKANATGPFGYILKPFGERDLAVQLENALAKHRANRALLEQEKRLKQANQQFIKAQQTLLAAQRGAKAGVWEIDLRTHQFTWSAPYYELHGLDPALQPSPELWISTVHPDDRARVSAEHERSLREKRNQTMEFRIVKPDGTIRWIRRTGEIEFTDDGEPIRMSGISFDITDRKQSEDAVSAVAMFPAQNPSPVLRVNVAGILLYMNPASAHLLGLLHLQIGEPAPSFLRDLVRQSLDAGRSENIEYEIAGRHYLITITPIVSENYANLYWTDISERKQAEQRFRELVNVMPAAMYTIDTDGRITYYNDLAAELWGARPQIGDDEVRYCGSFRLFWPDGTALPPDRTPMVDAVRDGTSVRGIEVCIERRDGSRKIVSVNIDPIKDGNDIIRGAINVFTDITDRKQADAALRENQERLRAIVDTAVDGVITIDEGGIIESVNPAVERIFQYSQQQLIGQNIKMLMPEPDHRQHDSYLERYRETGERKIIGIGREVVGRRKDGSVFPLDLSISESLLPHRRFFTGIVRDISAQARRASFAGE